MTPHPPPHFTQRVVRSDKHGAAARWHLPATEQPASESAEETIGEEGRDCFSGGCNALLEELHEP